MSEFQKRLGERMQVTFIPWAQVPEKWLAVARNAVRYVSPFDMGVSESFFIDVLNILECSTDNDRRGLKLPISAFLINAINRLSGVNSVGGPGTHASQLKLNAQMAALHSKAMGTLKADIELSMKIHPLNSIIAQS
jgi:hypothetical protein